MRRTAGVLMAMFFLLAGGAQPGLAAEDPAPLDSDVLPVVTVAQAQKTLIERRVPVSGTLVARQEVQIHPGVAGQAVTDIFVDVGDRVEPGQELARLQDASLAAQLVQSEAELRRAEAAAKQAESQIASAEAALTEAATALERARRLRTGGNASQAALDQAIAAEAGARAAADSAHDGLSVAIAAKAQAAALRDIARLNLGFTHVTSPVAGVVSARAARIGALSGAAPEPMFTITANGEIELLAEVVETAVPAISPGDEAVLTVAGVGKVKGHVRLLPATIDPLTRLGELRISIDGDGGFLPGMFASGEVILSSGQSLAVPLAAVLSDETGDYVQVVEKGRVETRPVTAGVIWNGRREITSGLDEGETVLARAGAFFATGDKVQPASETGGTSQ